MSIKNNSVREQPDIKEPLLLFKHLKTELDKLKSQFNNLKKIKLTSKLLHGINLKKGDELCISRALAERKFMKFRFD